MHQEFFDLLRRDHLRISKLLIDLNGAETPQVRKRLLNELHQELLPHLIAEEETFYPALEQDAECRQAVRFRREEHHTARMILDLLFEDPASAERLQTRLGELTEVITDHLEQEEGEMFEEFARRIEPRQAGRVLELFQMEKNRVHRALEDEVIIPVKIS